MTSRSPDARDRLLSAAIDLFGRKGFDGTSTREIASAAGVNIAGIAYHFGGKERLYAACAAYIAERVRRRVAGPLPTAVSDPASEFWGLAERFARFLLATPEAASFARFVLREQMDPSPAFDHLYEQLMAPLHGRLCELWAGATGTSATSQRTRLKVFALLSPVFVFRMARAGVLRRMEWDDVGERQLGEILAAMRETFDALLAQERLRGRE
jgi:TetR/AcrR family transcriptional regulator, regulator of cefoperazone and chloramphenicol sensitivity